MNLGIFLLGSDNCNQVLQMTPTGLNSSSSWPSAFCSSISTQSNKHQLYGQKSQKEIWTNEAALKLLSTRLSPQYPCSTALLLEHGRVTEASGKLNKWNTWSWHGYYNKCILNFTIKKRNLANKRNMHAVSIQLAKALGLQFSTAKS